MKDFLKENLLWILVPFVVVVGGVLVLLFGMGGEEGAQPFVYNVF
ncbi:MAG TPA: hypothetical protein VJP77_07660 [Planctomycetota bacterium]|nr:hypothetical protein [Planctomycetota bacterium]